MSFMDRIQNIESRFNSIEARFNPDAAQTKVPVGQEMQGQQSFSQVYQSMMQTGGGKVNYDQMQMGFNPSMSAAASSTGSENQYDQYINASAKKYGVDPNLIKGMIKQESGFNQNAVSHCGAQGLMQLMPDTARELGVQDAFNPAQNIDGGAKYIRKMLDMFDGDLKKAVAAYNAGPGNVQKHNGIPPIEETQNYVVKVLGNYSSYRSGG